MPSEIIKKTNQVLSKVPETLNRTDIQRLDRMINGIEAGTDDAKKNNEILKIMKIKMASSKQTIEGVKSIAILDKQEIDQGRLQLERDKFEYKKLKESIRIIPENVEDEEGYFKEVEGLVHIKHLIRQHNQSVGGNPLHMPTHKELAKNGLSNVAMAIIDYHGGFEEVAKKLSLEFIKPKTLDTIPKSRFTD